MTDTQPWPPCCAPLCTKEADYHLYLEGDCGMFGAILK